MVDASPRGRRTVILGQGYVGLPLAIRAAQVGHRVIGFDTDAGRVKRLKAAEPLGPDVTADEIAAVLTNAGYTPTTCSGDLAGFDVAVIAVPTPLRDGAPDLSAVLNAGRMLAPHMRPGCVIILESTTYPGTTEDILQPLLESASGLAGGADFHLGYSPERIDPGNRTWTLQNTPEIVSGIDASSLAAISDFYRGLVDTVVEVAAVRDAEPAKVLENTFRQVNIALVNELATHTRQLGTAHMKIRPRQRSLTPLCSPPWPSAWGVAPLEGQAELGSGGRGRWAYRDRGLGGFAGRWRAGHVPVLSGNRVPW
ncbi:MULTISPECIES: nucleotide sugar dehydrogenase [Streptomyces]|uniref:nucleotide sugar dehydrogenase n=1 Tax=Streptomyces TaxID=1883 RepID=UPI00211F3DFA|nr:MULTISPECIES: nucleotide sugar dehydrogenase [Streptomyces]